MKTETNAERLLMTNIIKASPDETYESIEDELLKVQNDPAHVIIIDSMNEWAALVSEEKDRRIRELEEALESVLPFANEVLTKQGKDPDTREIFGYNNQALNIGQMRKIVQALNPSKP